MNKYTIGVDFGTLSSRAVLVNTDNGKQTCDSVMEYRHGVMSEKLCEGGEILPADYALQDPRDYLEALEHVIHGVIEKSGVDVENIIGVGIDFTGCTVLPVYSDGTPLSFDEKFRRNKHAYVKLWKHHGAQKYADMINEKIRKNYPQIAERYGGTVSSEWTVPKIMDILDNAPEIYNACDLIIEAGDWITWVITGSMNRGYGFASYDSFYVDELGGYPEKEFFASLDKRLCDVVQTKLRGDIVRQGEKVGEITARAAKWLGLKEGTAVCCPMLDAHTAPISLGMNKNGDMCAIMGTSSCYHMINKNYKGLSGICGVIKDGMTPGFYAYATGLCCVGDMFAWAENNVVTKEYLEEAEKRKMPVIKLLIEKAAKTKPGQSGLVALNWFNGNRNILIDSQLSGMILGITLRTKPEDIMRALIEASAFGTRIIIENFTDNGLDVGRIIAAGGISRKDPFTMQVYADILGREIGVTELGQASAISGGIQAAVAAGSDAGGYDTLEEAMERMSGKCDTFYRPIKENQEIYNRLYKEYVTLHDHFGRGGNNVMKTLRKISAESMDM